MQVFGLSGLIAGIILLAAAAGFYAKIIPFRLGKFYQIGMLLMVGGGLFLMNSEMNWINLSGVGVVTPQPAVLPAAVTPTTGCPDTLAVNQYWKFIDTGASTLTYRGVATAYLQRQSDGVLISAAGGVTTGYSGATALTCGQAYKLMVPTGSLSYNATSSVVNEPFTAGAQPVYTDARGIMLAAPQVHIKDLTTDSYYYTGNNLTWAANCVGALNATTYTTVDSMGVGGTSSYAANSISTDGYYDIQIMFKSNTSNYFIGEPGLPVYLCVDTGTASAWQEPSVSVDNGAKLVNVKGSLNADDQTGSLVAASEFCYAMTQDGKVFGDTEHKVNFQMKARSGVDPAAADSPVLSILPVGRYASSKIANAVREGIYTDAATQVLVVHGSAIVPKILLCTS